MWKRCPIATSILESWWNSAGDSYKTSIFRSKWRVKWPWEQAQMYKIYDHFSPHIQVLSFPTMPHLPWLSTKNPKSQYPTDFIEPWCLSHWPGANCFITHFCASNNQKMRLLRVFDERQVSCCQVDSDIIPISID